MELMHANCRNMSVLFKKIKKAFSLERKIRKVPKCRMSHHKIKNLFKSEKRTNFKEKKLSEMRFSTNMWYVA